MKIEKNLIFSLVAPLMILQSIVGLTSKENHKKFLYLPIGIMGICIILEGGVSRKLKRKKILKKINYYQRIKWKYILKLDNIGWLFFKKELLIN